MKKYIRLAAATISLVVVFLSLPLFVKKTVTPVDLIFPDEMQVSRDIPVSGEIEEIAKKGG